MLKQNADAEGSIFHNAILRE